MTSCRQPPTMAPCADSWHCCKQLLASLAAWLLASWGALERSVDIRDHNTGHFEVHAQIFLVFADLRTVFWKFFKYLGSKNAHGCPLACWVPLLWCPGGPGTILGRSWNIGEYKKGHFEVQAWIWSLFSWLESFLNTFEKIILKFSSCVNPSGIDERSSMSKITSAGGWKRSKSYCILIQPQSN